MLLYYLIFTGVRLWAKDLFLYLYQFFYRIRLIQKTGSLLPLLPPTLLLPQATDDLNGYKEGRRLGQDQAR